jgi:hypothetical protein
MPQNYIKFYGNDWRSDPRLRVCSAASRGVWIDLITFMMEAEPFGYLLINDKQPTPEQIGMLTCTPPQVVKKALVELEEAGVFSRCEDGTIYSRRMVRDRERSEEGRKHKLEGIGRSPPSSPPPRVATSPPSPEKVERPSTHAGARSFQKPEATSVPNGTGGHGPPPDPVKALFDSAVEIFEAAGKPPNEARSIAGKLRKNLGDEKAAETIKAAHGKSEPAAYIIRILNDEITRRKRLATEHAPL